MKIPFNKPYMTGKELSYISEAHALRHLSGDGCFHQKVPYLARATRWLRHGTTNAFLYCCFRDDRYTYGYSARRKGIMPSYTYVSTANAFVLRGGIPVFVDIRPDTLNIDESLIEEAITPRTKAIVPIHYAGVACEMDKILTIAKRHDLRVVEDAAQGFMSLYKGRVLS